jgi:F0F1-type ATP synthase membrane subunit c/vacuolar-type H+-ATPase subunit K
MTASGLKTGYAQGMVFSRSMMALASTPACQSSASAAHLSGVKTMRPLPG